MVHKEALQSAPMKLADRLRGAARKYLNFNDFYSPCSNAVASNNRWRLA
jgi:hypothetical protein